MTIAFLTPFGARHEESGLMYLVANYVRARVDQTAVLNLVQLRCNGAFSVCDRDADRDWKRGMHSCLSCMQDQRDHAEWSGITTVDATTLLPSEVVESTKRFAALVETRDLLSVTYEGQDVSALWRGSFVARFGSPVPDLSNKQQEQFVRRLLLSALRSIEIAKRFNNKFQPVVSCVAGGEDFFARSFLEQSRIQGRAVARFRWDLHQRVILIESSRREEPFSCELVLEGVTEMRQDVSSWSQPVVEIAENIVQFLEIAPALHATPASR